MLPSRRCPHFKILLHTHDKLWIDCTFMHMQKIDSFSGKLSFSDTNLNSHSLSPSSYISHCCRVNGAWAHLNVNCQVSPAGCRKFRCLLKKKGFLTLECHYVHQPRSSFCHQFHVAPPSIHGSCRSSTWCDYWWIPVSHTRGRSLIIFLHFLAYILISH